MSSSLDPQTSTSLSSSFQDRLIGQSISAVEVVQLTNADFCRTAGFRTPTWQIVSDRRGGRTAWSCTVVVNGQHVGARFWYSGEYVNNAKEDAAERALQLLGVLPTPNGPSPAHLQAQQSQHLGAMSI